MFRERQRLINEGICPDRRAKVGPASTPEPDSDKPTI